MPKMKTLSAVLIIVLVLTSPAAVAGVVLGMTTRDASGQQTQASKIYAQSEMVRIDSIGGGSDEQISMIFRDDVVLMINHSDKTYIVLDEAMLEEIGSRMSAAMQQMEAQLAQMPPEQRAMVEKMMQGQMQGMMSQHDAASTPPLRVERGELSEWKSYPCVRYSVYTGDEKSEDICAASHDAIAGIDDVMQGFRKMSGFLTRMLESLPDSFGGMAENPMNMLEQIDGFPVYTAHLEKGAVSAETTLDSATEESLDESMFVAPAGYREQDLFQGR